MQVTRLLEKKKDEILKKWFYFIVDTYPAETSRFLRKEKNPFGNPVGQAIREGIGGIFDELAGDVNPERVSPHLDRIVRVRAVQDFSPSQAVYFVFALKRLIREELEEEIQENEVTAEDLAVLDSRVDQLALVAFDVYSACRERLHEIRVDEVKNRTFRLLQRSNLIDTNFGQESAAKDGKDKNQK